MLNKGYVTIFISLLVMAILLIAITTITITDRSMARTKISTAVNTAMSSEMANYDRLIFDRYHILLLDKCASGAGEGAIEASMEENLRSNLGDSFTVNSVELSGCLGIMDDGCSEFKKQINDNFKYNVASIAVDKILEKTSGQDQPIGQKELENIDSDIDEKKKSIEESEENSKNNNKESDDSNKEAENSEADNKDKNDNGIRVIDPRITLQNYVSMGLEGLLLPQDISIKGNVVSMEDLPSDGQPQNKIEEIETNFTNINRMKMDAVKGNGWADSLITNAEAVVYASTYFNCLTEKKYDDTYLDFEMEYIVGGKKSEGENYKRVVDEIILIRFGMNLVYIITDSVKMNECKTTATLLTIEFPPAEPVVEYLLAGCWAYIESIADVYRLLRGHSVPFIKSMDTWTTDFESLSHLESLVSLPSDEERGLNYKEYLMILIALRGDTMYYRMLDLMQLNIAATEEEYSDPDFRMSNAITAFGVNADVSYGGEEFKIHEERGY
ncbi:MAG: DUF5702 domain-containing protein [Eubacterium sp.]|nr:DUF5702 domain-containing protein [Eubacterium sp.]